jgi:DUF917 family protein
VSVTRNVDKGFTRGSVTLEPISPSETETRVEKPGKMFVEFENENLIAVLKTEGEADRVLAVCPDLIQVCTLTFTLDP